MLLESLSATSVKTFLSCESRWAATYSGERRRTSSDAADLGSACHLALEKMLVLDRKEWCLRNLEVLFVEAIDEVVGHGKIPKWLEEGMGILRTWWDRQDWDDWAEREIISLEQRSEFTLPTSIGDIPFVYIIDRLDRMSDGELEVVDYKSGFFQVRADDLKYDVQARSYALAVWLAHNKPKRVWVLFDYLRNDIPSASVAFTAADCKEHMLFLQEMAEKIIESGGQEETPNGTCRFCPRALECSSLYKMALTDLHGMDIEQLAVLKLQVMGAVTALEANKRRIDTTLREALDQADNSEITVQSGHTINLTLGRRERIVNWQKVSTILGIPPVPAKISPVAFSEYLDHAEADGTHSEGTIEKLRDCIIEERGTPQVRVIKPLKMN